MDKKTYKAAPGVEWVNGDPVPKNRKIELTEAEAVFDLGYARIELDEAKPTAAATQTTAFTGKPA